MDAGAEAPRRVRYERWIHAVPSNELPNAVLEKGLRNQVVLPWNPALRSFLNFIAFPAYHFVLVVRWAAMFISIYRVSGLSLRASRPLGCDVY